MISCNWLGDQAFYVYTSPAVAWADVGGVYLFVKRDPLGDRVPLYVGQASSLKNRLPNHERWPEAQRLGANEIHAKTVDNASARTHLEVLLIQGYDPRMNEQHTTR